jgi:hypothetical protein
MASGSIGSGNAHCRAASSLHENRLCRAKLARCSSRRWADIEIRPPAVRGDILDAVKSGVCAIDLMDGNFEFVAPIWHKEILFALSMGVQVSGAASMGALRAAECAAFGMVGVGKIYEGYVSGRLFDDADVALLHGPSELAWIPLIIPIVNVTATLDFAYGSGTYFRPTRSPLWLMLQRKSSIRIVQGPTSLNEQTCLPQPNVSICSKCCARRPSTPKHPTLVCFSIAWLRHRRNAPLCSGLGNSTQPACGAL